MGLLGDSIGWKLTPPWRQPRGKTIVSLVNSYTNATSKRLASVGNWLTICHWVASRMGRAAVPPALYVSAVELIWHI